MSSQPLRKPGPHEAGPSFAGRRWSEPSGGSREGAPAGGADELSLKVQLLEAEVASLRELLDNVQASRKDLRQELDDLRRDRDRWQSLARSAGAEKSGTRAWFCGRVSPSR